MLNPASNTAISSSSVVRMIPWKIFPPEMQEEVEKYLQPQHMQKLFQANIEPARGDEVPPQIFQRKWISLQKIKSEIQSEYPEMLSDYEWTLLVRSEFSLKGLVLDGLQALWHSGKLDQILEKATFFEVLQYFIAEPEIIRFLKEKIYPGSVLEKNLLAKVEDSKTGKVEAAVAANAMTLLVKVGVQFNGADLNGIQIPGADLSSGVFDSAQLQGADLSRVNLSNAWLREANLSGAKMSEVQFGEQPYFQEERKVHFCAYSPDGKTFAVGFSHCTISVYATSNWGKIHTLEGYFGWLGNVVYSPNGRQIAASGKGNVVRLWSAQTGAVGPILEGHTSGVTWVAYSPNGRQITSCSLDNTVRVWDAQTGRLCHTLEGQTDVGSVAYSPNGERLALIRGREVRLWNIQADDGSTHILINHQYYILSLVYSPDGRQIATGDEDHTVRLWDAETGELCRTLKGHTDNVNSVAYSPDGRQIVSGSSDWTVRLWDVQTGQPCQTLEGHTARVKNVAYSPDGRQIASCEEGNTVVRLWSTKITEPSPPLQSLTSSVISVVCSSSSSDSSVNTVQLWDAQTSVSASQPVPFSSWNFSQQYSPNREQIITARNNNTLELRNSETRTVDVTLTGHTDFIGCAAYSPNGKRIASSSGDQTVRLWDTASGRCLAVIGGRGCWNSSVSSIAWKENGGNLYLITGHLDQSVRQWQVTEKEGQYQVRLCWLPISDRLIVSNVCIQDVQGLSPANQKLLRQRGAADESLLKLRKVILAGVRCLLSHLA